MSESPGQRSGPAWEQVSAVVAAVSTALGKWLLDEHGIGLTDYRAVRHLARTAEHELRITELAQRIGLNQSSTTRLVARLEAKGLTLRDTCPEDGRGVYAVVTPHGIELIAALEAPYEAKVHELLRAAAGEQPPGEVHRAFEAVSRLLR